MCWTENHLQTAYGCRAIPSLTLLSLVLHGGQPSCTPSPFVIVDVSKIRHLSCQRRPSVTGYRDGVSCQLCLPWYLDNRLCSVLVQAVCRVLIADESNGQIRLQNGLAQPS